MGLAYVDNLLPVVAVVLIPVRVCFLALPGPGVLGRVEVGAGLIPGVVTVVPILADSLLLPGCLSGVCPGWLNLVTES